MEPRVHFRSTCQDCAMGRTGALRRTGGSLASPTAILFLSQASFPTRAGSQLAVCARQKGPRRLEKQTQRQPGLTFTCTGDLGKITEFRSRAAARAA